MRNNRKARTLSLSVCWNKLSGTGRWLVHNTGIELTLVGGPYRNQKQFLAGLNAFLRSEDFEEEDTVHILTFIPNGPEFSEFSSWFMEKALRRAGRGPDAR